MPWPASPSAKVAAGAEPKDAWRVSMQLADGVKALYRTHDPAGYSEQRVDKLLRKHGGREAALIEATKRKFGVATLDAAAHPPGSLHTVIFLDIDGVLHPAYGVKQPGAAARRRRANGEAGCSDDSDGEALPAPRYPGDPLAEADGAHFHRRCMACLASAVESTSADIVLSSTWRLTASGRREANAALRRYRIAAAAGNTPHGSGGCLSRLLRGLCCCAVGGAGRGGGHQDEIARMCDERVDEIQAWLRRHPQTKRWCAVDDLHLAAGNRGAMRGQCVRTGATTGMTEQDARAVIAVLRGAPSPANAAAAAAEALLLAASAPPSPSASPRQPPARSSRRRRASTSTSDASDVAAARAARRDGSRRRARHKVQEGEGGGGAASPLSIKFHSSARAAQSLPGSRASSPAPTPKGSPRGSSRRSRWQQDGDG